MTGEKQLLTKHHAQLVDDFTALCKREGRTKKGYIELLIRNELAKNRVKQVKNG